jgi:hypothetical protein
VVTFDVGGRENGWVKIHIRVAFPKAGRDGEMDAIGDVISQPVKVERRLVRNGPAAETPKGPANEVFVLSARIFAQPVQASSCT